MIKYIAILRGINVGGRNKILMADLRALLSSKNLKNVNTYIQTGNIFFESSIGSNEELEGIIKEKIDSHYHYDIPVIVRKKSEILALKEIHPFLSKSEDPKKLHVTFLKTVPDKASIAKIEFNKYLPDECFIEGSHIFLFIPNRYGDTKLSNAFFEKKLNVKASTRNWKTVNTLITLMSKD